MNSVVICEKTGRSAFEAEVEIVERKGLGHPDTICDAVAEQISRELSNAYLSRYGRILHHNCDKALLVAGAADLRWGGGQVVTPMRLVIGDRATASSGGIEIDIEQITTEAVRRWFKENLRFVVPDQHLVCQFEMKPGSQELAAIFSRSSPIANDTSAVIGYAPLTDTEKLVLETEHYLNSASFKDEFPETGEDVKVMGVRNRSQLSMTVAMPFIDRYLENERSYFLQKQQVRQKILERTRREASFVETVDVVVNALDEPGKGLPSCYLSVLGTSAENADSGQVGRGNDASGIISLNRPRGAEALAGKNPVSHIGKIYTALAFTLAKKLYKEIDPVLEAYLSLCGRIGQPIDRPLIVYVQLLLEKGTGTDDIEVSVRELIEEQLSRLDEFCQSLIGGDRILR